MKGSHGKVGFLLLHLVVLVGCGGAAEPVRLDLTGVEPSADLSNLEAVLAAAVSDAGRVRCAALMDNVDCLDRQLRLLAVTGPTATPRLYPTPASRWAYWYNARAAWSMKLAALEGCRRSGLSARRRRSFRLDGRSLCLERIDRIILSEARRAGDFRLAAAAPGVCVDYGPMPTRPYQAKDFPAAAAEGLNRLVLDERRFVLDVDNRRLLLPPLLWEVRGMVRDQYRRSYGSVDAELITALRPHLGRRARRRLDEAIGYAVVPQAPRAELAVTRRKIYFPGKIGKVEP